MSAVTVELLADGAAALFQDGAAEHTVTQVGKPGQFKFTEGPTWSSKYNSWFFVCIPGNTIYRYQYTGAAAAGGELTTFRSPSNHANGMFFDPVTHALVVCEHKTRCVTTNDVATGARTVLKGTDAVFAQRVDKSFLSSISLLISIQRHTCVWEGRGERMRTLFPVAPS